MLIRSLKTVVFRILCKHEYDTVDSFLIDSGMRKEIVLKCRKCGKIKVTMM